MKSHPLRVRELKRVISFLMNIALRSHPLRVRELKLTPWHVLLPVLRVAPFTGA